MINGKYHFAGRDTTGKKIIIDAAELYPGKFEIMAMRPGGREVEVMTAATEQEAAEAWRAMVDRHTATATAAPPLTGKYAKLRDDLRAAIRTVAGGDAMLSPAVTRRVMQAAARGAGIRDTGQLDRLTDREREILAEVGLGLSNDDIGAKLFISPATVRTHVTRILTKLAVRDRANLVAIAFRSGLVGPEDR